MKTRKTLVVCGIPRSGTSMVAGILRCLGFDMGDRIKPDKHEDLDILFKPRNLVVEVIKHRNKTKELWGFKTPWIGDMIHLVGYHFINPKYIYIKRNKKDAIRSDLIRNPKSNKPYIEKRNRLLTESLECFLENIDHLQIDYDKVIGDPYSYVMKIVDFIGEPVTNKDIQRAVKFIQPGGYRTI